MKYKTIVTSIERYNELIRTEEKLNALEAGGVDNWDWYSESLKEYHKKYFGDKDDAS